MENPWTKIIKLICISLALDRVQGVIQFLSEIKFSQLKYIVIVHRNHYGLPNPEKHIEHQTPIMIANMHKIHAFILYHIYLEV